jgi:electron transfer flavoprotein beta subunit
MRIIVPIKQILDPRGLTIRRDKERVFVNREEYIIDPGSKAAIEAALRLKEDTGATVIAITVGEPRADDALREALAMGCDAAHLLCDPDFGEVDTTGTARILVAAIEKLGSADLILAGRESVDSAAGQIGPRLADLLGFAQVTDVWGLQAEEGQIRCSRRWGDGFAAVGTPLPAMVSVAPEAFSPRLAHGARIMSAYREWQVPIWSAADLDLERCDLVPLLSFRSEGFPPPLEVGEVFRGDAAEVAQDLIAGLKLHRLVR